VEAEALPGAEACPWAGTVSHHLLAHVLIDRWFSELASRRQVETFYVLSPSHWGLSTQTYSLTDGAWKVDGGTVYSDRQEAARLARGLEVNLEPAVFDPEHGVSTLMPYIAEYFPRAKVVAICYRGEPPLDQPMASRLVEALAPRFDAKGKMKNFLLISTDFAHHGDREGTDLKDDRTRRFFSAPSAETWIFAGCDNRPGIYTLSRLLDPSTRCSVLYRSDSFELSGHGADDITSYFFTFFWDSPP
jgi:MEMO1 family protein